MHGNRGDSPVWVKWLTSGTVENANQDGSYLFNSCCPHRCDLDHSMWLICEMLDGCLSPNFALQIQLRQRSNIGPGEHVVVLDDQFSAEHTARMVNFQNLFPAVL